MGNLFTSMLNSASAMQVYSRQLAVIQNNISNSNTPGYAKQTQELEAMHFDIAHGLAGGVSAGPVVSSRSEYAERTVQSQVSQLGTAEQKASDLSQISTLFDLTSTTGIDSSLNNFFNTFSQLGVNPNDTLSRQNVLDSAQALAGAFNQTASSLSSASTEVDTQITGMVDTVNQLTAKIRDINAMYQQNPGSASDAGLDAQMHAALEQLSETVGITALKTPSGTFSVYLGGQTALVVGGHQFDITAQVDQNQTTIVDGVGNDITGQITAGRLAGALQEKNDLIPSYKSDLNTLASTVADQVNHQLQVGVDQNGATPIVDMFSYDSTVGAALSLRANSMTPDQIAAADPSSPGGNANALNVADMLGTKMMGTSTYNQFFGNIGGRVGNDLANAQSDQTTRQGLVDQARNLRSQVSGVSLDQEAAELLQVQRAYQASAKVMSMLNDIMDSLMQTMMAMN
jgi:flagellar hook-associated protein 1 FlgK